MQSRSPKLTKERKDELTQEYEQEIKEARFEIGAFGSPEVIQALVNWFRIIAKTDETEADLWKQDVKIYQAMRKEIFGKERVQIDDGDLYDVLFKYLARRQTKVNLDILTPRFPARRPRGPARLVLRFGARSKLLTFVRNAEPRRGLIKVGVQTSEVSGQKWKT